MMEFFCENNLPFNDQCSHHIETSQLICSANQLTGFYIMEILVVKMLMAKSLLLLLQKIFDKVLNTPDFEVSTLKKCQEGFNSFY